MIANIFVIINTTVFVALCIYIVKNYLIPFVQARTRAEQLHHETLIKRRELLVKQRTNLEREVLHQNYLYAILSEKLERWQRVITQRRTEQHHTTQHNAHHAQQRHAQQMQYQATRVLHRTLLIPATAQARQDLEALFQSRKAVENYYAAIFNYMRQEIS